MNRQDIESILSILRLRHPIKIQQITEYMNELERENLNLKQQLAQLRKKQNNNNYWKQRLG